MFKRVLDFFKRDKAKKELPKTTVVSNPEPRNVPKEKVRRSWISRWVRFRLNKKQSKEIYGGSHEAHPKHVIKPLRRIEPRKVFYSTRTIK